MNLNLGKINHGHGTGDFVIPHSYGTCVRGEATHAYPYATRRMSNTQLCVERCGADTAHILEVSGVTFKGPEDFFESQIAMRGYLYPELEANFITRTRSRIYQRSTSSA